MINKRIEDLTSQIRQDTGQTSIPVNVYDIAEKENIGLAPGSYGNEFEGRIEFHAEQNKFILFYPDPAKSNLPTRIRFSVSHELGHYFLEDHRELLVRGCTHNSHPGFTSDNALEREADCFAASLLIPEAVLSEFCSRKKFYTLKELLELANSCEASATCTAIRYTQWTAECCSIVLSRDGQILCYIPSDDAECRGFKWLGRRVIPNKSCTARIKDVCRREILEEEGNTEVWFSERRIACTLWEEAFPLGHTGLVLTMLTFDV